MKITVTEDLTPGQLLRKLMEKRTGVIRMQATDMRDHPVTVTIADQTYEAVATEFAAAVRADYLRQGAKPPYEAE